MAEPRKIELLAPAKNAEIGKTAILAGADAVYIGAPAFGARQAASNTVADIGSLVDFAHKFRAKVYVTLNTILYDTEIEQAQELVWQLYAVGVDAIIVQDMAYLEMKLPPIALHASTQCDIRSPQKARWLAQAGFSQLVLPREFTLSEISEAAKAAELPVEVFVHGALCVSYSGDCQAGFVATGRSANRGECPQMCRLPYTIVDAKGNEIAPARHYLSLRDLRQIDNLQALIDAGASSFKIEGRLKDARYVANVTAAYSKALNKIISASNGSLVRSSKGTSTPGFNPLPAKTFNRGYTTYFVDANKQIASILTPKSVGQEIGKVISAFDPKTKSFKVETSVTLNNGDGLGFFDSNKQFRGFRLNRIEGKRIYVTSQPEGLKPGTVLYRNVDKAFFDLLDRPYAGCVRKIDIEFSLKACPDGFTISAIDERGCAISVRIETTLNPATSPQQERRRENLSKLGDTIYRCISVDDTLGELFIPQSVLATARREAIALLDKAACDTYVTEPRLPNRLTANAFESMPPLTYHQNVANQLAKVFYTRHGAKIEQNAIETLPPTTSETVVMTTRYCLRRELGACLKDKDAKNALPQPFFLKNESGLYRLDFDCANCGMKVVKTAAGQ